MTPSLLTIPNVPLVSTGIEYPLSSGPWTPTEDDLQSIVASQDDPAIIAPRLKLSSNGVHGDAINEPCFGKAVNLRLGDNNQTVYCDYEGVPAWLAEVLPAAYPNRSIEGQPVETVTGHNWPIVIMAVELLGVTWPGISTLPDLPLYYGDALPPGVEVAAARSTVGDDDVLHGKGSSVSELNGELAASVNVEDVRRDYYDTLNSDQMWWWIRAIYLDPNELIVDDDDGALYRVPFTVSGEAVSFADPVEVKVEYVDVPRAKQAAMTVAAVSAVRGEEHTRAVYASKAESRPDNQEVSVDAKALRKSLGLAEDASDDEVKAKFASSMGEAEPPAEPAEPTGDDENDDVVEKPTEPTEPAASTDDEDEPAAASGDRVAQIDTAQLEQLKRDAEAGVAARRAQVEAEADSLVKAAVEDGRITPASKKDWRAAILPNGKTELVKTEVDTLASLAAGRIPVDERGEAEGVEGNADGHEDYMAQHFPQTVRRLSRRGTGVRHRQEV